MIGAAARRRRIQGVQLATLVASVVFAYFNVRNGAAGWALCNGVAIGACLAGLSLWGES